MASLAVTAGLLTAVSAVNAATLSYEDDDIDFHMRVNATTGELEPVPIGSIDPITGAPSNGTEGDFAVGDVLVAVFEIDPYTIDGVNGIPADQELTGMSAIQIESFDADGDIVFKAYDGGLNEVLAIGTNDVTVTDGGAGEGAMLAMWFNSTTGVDGDIDLDLNRTSNLSTN